jgi:hypothetical protein
MGELEGEVIRDNAVTIFDGVSSSDKKNGAGHSADPVFISSAHER